MRLFLIILLLIWPSSILAETFCAALSNEIKNRQISDRLDLPPLDYFGENKLGINFDYNYDEEKQEWNLVRDNDGNPIVFNTLLKNGEQKIYLNGVFCQDGSISSTFRINVPIVFGDFQNNYNS